jgi:hypothetical protein
MTRQCMSLILLPLDKNCWKTNILRHARKTNILQHESSMTMAQLQSWKSCLGLKSSLVTMV